MHKRTRNREKTKIKTVTQLKTNSGYRHHKTANCCLKGGDFI